MGKDVTYREEEQNGKSRRFSDDHLRRFIKALDFIATVRDHACHPHLGVFHIFLGHLRGPVELQENGRKVYNVRQDDDDNGDPSPL
jgi:hypothetical protein